MSHDLNCACHGEGAPETREMLATAAGLTWHIPRSKGGDYYERVIDGKVVPIVKVKDWQPDLSLDQIAMVERAVQGDRKLLRRYRDYVADSILGCEDIDLMLAPSCLRARAMARALSRCNLKLPDNCNCATGPWEPIENLTEADGEVVVRMYYLARRRYKIAWKSGGYIQMYTHRGVQYLTALRPAFRPTHFTRIREGE